MNLNMMAMTAALAALMASPDTAVARTTFNGPSLHGDTTEAATPALLDQTAKAPAPPPAPHQANGEIPVIPWVLTPEG